ncbi:response regulator [bacterium]|nr:response regulator [bacterium]
MSAHILVVDDDDKIRQLLRRCFEPEGYRVTDARNQAEALAAVELGDVDLMTLDLHLGSDDGLSVARAVRSKTEIPIVMVTGKDDVIDRVVGLELGADDYITKPFHLRELLARVRSVLRRSGSEAGAKPREEASSRNVARFGHWTADFDSLQVRDDQGRSADLTSSEMRLLEALAKRPNRVLTRDQLMDMVKGQEWESFDRAIDNQIARLRKKLEADPKNPQFLKTVRGEGYVFTPGAVRG